MRYTADDFCADADEDFFPCKNSKFNPLNQFFSQLYFFSHAPIVVKTLHYGSVLHLMWVENGFIEK